MYYIIMHTCVRVFSGCITCYVVLYGGLVGWQEVGEAGLFSVVESQLLSIRLEFPETRCYTSLTYTHTHTHTHTHTVPPQDIYL